MDFLSGLMLLVGGIGGFVSAGVTLVHFGNHNWKAVTLTSFICVSAFTIAYFGANIRSEQAVEQADSMQQKIVAAQQEIYNRSGSYTDSAQELLFSDPTIKADENAYESLEMAVSEAYDSVLISFDVENGAWSEERTFTVGEVSEQR